MQARVDAGLVARFALRRDGERVIEELQRTLLRLGAVTLLQRGRQVQQRVQARRFADQQVPEMRAQRQHEMQGVEAFRKDLVESQQSRRIIAGDEGVHQLEGVFVVQDVEVAHHVLILDIGAAERHRLVEDGQRVAHRTVGLLGDDVQGLVVDRDPLLLRDGTKVGDDVRDGDAVEVVGLAAGQDGRDDLVLLGRGQDEYCVCRGLLEGLEEGVEGRGAQHVDLVDDIDAVPADLRRDLHLLQQGLDVIDAVVGRGIQLVDAEGAPFAERHAGLTLAARLEVGRRMGAVDRLREDAGGTGLADAPRTAEKVGVGDLAAGDGVLEGPGDDILADQALERVRPVFPC